MGGTEGRTMGRPWLRSGEPGGTLSRERHTHIICVFIIYTFTCLFIYLRIHPSVCNVGKGLGEEDEMPADQFRCAAGIPGTDDVA